MIYETLAFAFILFDNSFSCSSVIEIPTTAADSKLGRPVIGIPTWMAHIHVGKVNRHTIFFYLAVAVV